MVGNKKDSFSKFSKGKIFHCEICISKPLQMGNYRSKFKTHQSAISHINEMKMKKTQCLKGDHL